MKFKKDKILPIVLLSLAILTRFLFFGYPSEVVFDEVHFGKFASFYLNKKSFFDVHPPFGKLFLAFFAKILNFKISCPFESIGQKCEKTNFFVLRFLPSFFSALLVFVFYRFLSLLSGSETLGLVGGFLLLFENSFLTQGRFILIDIFLIFFGIFGMYLFLKYEKEKKSIFLILSSISLGLSFSTKWTGISFLVLTIFLIFLKKSFDLKKTLSHVFLILFLSFLTYSFLFFIHFSLIPNEPDQAAFVGKDFENLSFFKKFLKMQKTMFEAEESLEGVSHPYQSEPLEWIFMKKPIFYWVSGKKEIYLIGNKIVWYLSSFSLLILILVLVSNKFREKMEYPLSLAIFFFLGFLINFLPFFNILRPIFLYHYLPAYLFLIMNLSFLLNFLFKKSKLIFFSIFLLIVYQFFITLPLNYGL